MGRSPRRLVAVLDVFHPGLAGGHLLVCRRKRDRSGSLVGASLGRLALLARVCAIVDGLVEPLDRSGMHVAAADWPARQCHREWTGVQPMTCRDRLRDAGVAAGAVPLAAPLRCSLNWRAARHGARHLPSPLMGDARGERERDPTGEHQRPAPRVSIIFPKLRASARRASVAFGLRAEVLPAEPARYQVTPNAPRPFDRCCSR